MKLAPPNRCAHGDLKIICQCSIQKRFGEGGHAVNRIRKRKPRCILRWWKRRSVIEPVIGNIKSDHYMDRNMLGGVLGDKLDAVLASTS